MAKAEFSETQFVFGYLSEMYFRQVNNPQLFPFWEYFMFPSTIIERDFPVDFFADYYTHSEYYQFKRSEHLEQRRGSREIAEGVPVRFLDYYRFKIYNRRTTTHLGQFEKLRELAQRFPSDLVCYCAPCFHTETEFHYHFRNRNILSNSILIDCRQFNLPAFLPPNFDINDGLDHYFVYKLSSPLGYLCSEPIEFNVSIAKNRKEHFRKNESNKTLKETINVLYEEFYLKDEIYLKGEGPQGFDNKIITDNISKRFYIVGSYLLQYYNIAWQPIFIEK